MKILLLVLSILATFTLQTKAQSDTLVIKFKTGTIESIPVTDIQKITFDGLTSVEEKGEPDGSLTAKGNYPNPFAEKTTIEFEIASAGTVTVIIYDNNGKQIQTLVCHNCNAGQNTLEWDCLDKNGIAVPGGAYFYEVRYGKEVQSKKMLMVR